MYTSRITRTFIILIAFVAVVAAPLTTQAQTPRQIKAVATIGMITDIVRIVGGEQVIVTGLMGPGIDPHLYRATAGDVKTLSDANIIFYGGLNLESKMAEIFERLGSKIPTVAVSRDIPEKDLLAEPTNPQAKDPHIWFDVSFWSIATGTVAAELSKLDPTHAADYKARAEAYQKQLAALDQYTKDAILTIPKDQRLIITAHDAFHYYGRRYGIEVQGLQGVSTESEAGADDVRQLVDLIVVRKVPAIFVESSVPRRTIEAVQAAAKAQNWDVKIGGELFSDALGNPNTPEGTYIGMILHNNTTIVVALGGKMPPLPKELSP
jgi:manganese/zinc/iron transport system substrate-binding protein